MGIIQLDKKDIFLIRPLWEELNNLHGQVSTHFKDHFESFTFEKRFEQIQNKDAFVVLAAKEGSSYTGYCIASVENKIGEIDSIYIKPTNRKNKLGETLLSSAELWLKSKNVVKILVSVAEGNESVFHFYNKQGYYQRYTVLEKKV